MRKVILILFILLIYNNLKSQNNFTEISEFLDSAIKSGSKLIILPVGNFKISKSIFLENAQSVEITSLSKSTTIEISGIRKNESIFYITGKSNNLKISNINFKGALKSLNKRGITINEGKNIQVFNCSFRNLEYGIKGSSNSHSDSLLIKANKFDSVQMPIYSSINNTIITDCVGENFGNPSNALRHFIYLSSSEGKTNQMKVENSTANSGSGAGIRVVNCNIEIRANILSNCKYGILITSNSKAKISENKISRIDPLGYLITFERSTGHVFDNIFSEWNSQYGILIQNSQNIEVKNNRFIGNNMQGVFGVLYSKSSCQIKFINNEIANTRNSMIPNQSIIKLDNNSNQIEIRKNKFKHSTNKYIFDVSSNTTVITENEIEETPSVKNKLSNLKGKGKTAVLRDNSQKVKNN